MNVVEQINGQAVFLENAQAITGAQTIQCLKLLTQAVQAQFCELGLTELQSVEPTNANEV